VPDGFVVEFVNPSFEAADDTTGGAEAWSWSAYGEKQRGVATRKIEKASVGKWAMALEVSAEHTDPKEGIATIGQQKMIEPVENLYEWNSDISAPPAFRPGMVTGFSLDIANAGSTESPVYLRLCASVSATGYQYWGNTVTVRTESTEFVRRHVARRMVPIFDIDSRSRTVEMFAALFGGEESRKVILDNFSSVSVLYPKLGVSDLSPVDFGIVPRGKNATSQARTIFNSQEKTLPSQLTDKDFEETPVATMLYGLANLMKLENEEGRFQGRTDDVGAVLIGLDAAKFEFVSSDLGSTPQELKLIGSNLQPGLLGGPNPDAVPLTVRFVGSAQPGQFSATLRIVTQAGNLGNRSSFGAGEPPEGIYYVDIPVKATVQ
jgi:hypothetical protein